MIRKITTATAAILFLGFLLAVPAEARRGNRPFKAATQSATVQTQVQKGTCPFGYTPGTGRALKQGSATAGGRGFGPRDGTGVDRVRPRDGTGHGAVAQGWGRANNPNYDWSGVNRVRPQNGTGYRAIAQGRGRVNNPFCDGTGPRGRNPNRGGRSR